MSTVKVQLRETNKKVKISDVKTYEQFLALINKAFSGLPEVITFYYFDSDGDRVDIDGDETLEGYMEEYSGKKEKPKIIIKLPDEEFMNQSYF